MTEEKTAPSTSVQGVAALLPAINGSASSSDARTYQTLREDFDKATANIAAEREPLRQELKDCIEAADVTQIVVNAAQSDIDKAAEKVRSEAARINSVAAQDQQQVDAAQAEFDRAMAGDDEKEQQKAAERLHDAKMKQQAGSIMLNGLKLRLAGHEAVRARREQDLEEAKARHERAWEEIRMVEHRMAVLDADEAMNRALAAHLRVRQVQGTLSSENKRRCTSGMYGFMDLSFWFSAADRAVRWNPMLFNDGAGRGPVAIFGHNLAKLASEVTLPAGAIVPATTEDKE